MQGRQARSTLAIVLIASLFAALPARADDSLARCVERLDAAQASAQLARVSPELRAAERGARIWFGSWVSIMAALTAGALGLAFAPGQEKVWRDGYLASGASSTLSLLALLAPPLPTIRVSRQLGPETDAPRQRLTRALSLLRAAAEQERLLHSPAAQVLNVGVALTQGLYLGLRYDEGGAVALPNALSSFFVGELQILSAPRAAISLEQALIEERAPCVARGTPPPALSMQWLIGPQGLGARVRF